MNSYHDDSMATEGNASVNQDDRCLEKSYDGVDLLEEIVGIKSEESTMANMRHKLPRRPIKPNVYIDNETICPVCTQTGKFTCYCE